MEEIDNIIIESLKHIKCNIDEETTTIADFDGDMVVDAVTSCLETINPQTKYPHKLPASMSSRLKLASSLAEAIRELGFRGDIGYQTILYCNQIEVRRVLMFLVERLPRESDNALPTQDLGYVQKLKRTIEETVRLCLTKAWIPPVLLKQGSRQCGDFYLQQSCMYMHPLEEEILHYPHTLGKFSDEIKVYWIHQLPFVTKQCLPKNLIPSLLFRDVDFADVMVNGVSDGDYFSGESQDATDNITDVNNEILKEGKIEKVTVKNDKSELVLDELQSSAVNIEKYKERISEIKSEIKSNKSKLLEAVEARNKEESILKEYVAKYKIKSKTLAILSNIDNLAKLKSLVQNSNGRMQELENQWREVQMPLLKEYEELSKTVNSKEAKLQEKQTKVKDVRHKAQQLMEELRMKEKSEKQLKEECDRFSKNTGRSAYTKRILEIIANINKQNQEIQKILNDTKGVQKEINTLNGQLDRSFTLSDELIFRNAKQDEMSRKAYKLLATLHNDCGQIIQAVTELGLTERESRNLQEQIDSEASKSTENNYERVNSDLLNVRKETSALMKQVQV